MDLIKHLERQRNFSLKTFGPGRRTEGVIDHISKELGEIRKDPTDLMEWIDVILLACDGAWRAGHSPEDIAAALDAKLTKNENRDWPDWRTADPNKAIEHVRKPSEEPGVIIQASQPPANEIRDWISHNAEEAAKIGLHWWRVTTRLNPDLILFEAWKTQPENPGEARWSFTGTPS